jgi:hypothetical protein
MATNLTQVITLTREDSARVTGGKSILVADDPYMNHTTNIGLAEEEITLDPDITVAGMLYVRNDDPTNYIKFGFATGEYVSQVYPGEQGCIPLIPTASSFFAIADTAPCQIEYEITSREA